MPHDHLLYERIIAKSGPFDYQNRRFRQDFWGTFTFRHALATWLGLVFLHGLVWLMAARQTGESIGGILQHWDAAWYLRIAQNGYDAATSAFLPVYPLSLRFLAHSLGRSDTLFILGLGAVLSSLCFIAALYLLMVRPRATRVKTPSFIAGAVFLLSPASYVFHSFHTESLFLLCAVLAFRAMQRDQVLLAAAAAGVGALVRHQGVFLAIAMAVGVSVRGKGLGNKIARFTLVGVISASLWSLSSFYHLSQGREAFPAMNAHEQNWFVADGLATYFKTFILANPIQNYRIGSLLHQAYFLGLLLLSTVLIRRRAWAEAVYCILSLLIMPVQGELVDAFRFSAVLFPLLFVAGEKLEILPPYLRWVILLGMLAFNLNVTWQYGISRWAY